MLDILKGKGDRLGNGYIIERTDNRVAVIGHSEAKEEYAVWRFDCNGSTVLGHYFNYWNRDKDEAYNVAVEDYLERC